MTKSRQFALLVGLLAASTGVAQDVPSRFVDHSLMIAPEYPCTWPSSPFPRFQITHQRTIGPDSAYNIDVLLIDGNTGTQLDVPPHSVARPDLQREKSGPLGLKFTDKIEAWQFGGEACVVDVRDLLDQAPKGVSPLVKPQHVARFEQQHRRLRFGDVVLFRSDYSDKYYRPFPDGTRFIADVLDRKGSREMVGVEFLHNVGSIPCDKDAYFLFAALKIRDCHGGPGRALVLW